MQDLAPSIRQELDARLTYWKSRLHDLGRRNRLLFFKHTRSSTLEIVKPDPTDLFKRIVIKGSTLSFPLPLDMDDPLQSDEETASPLRMRQFGPNEVQVLQSEKASQLALYNLTNRSRVAREEQGVNVLYLGFGILKWQEAQGGEMSEAPLVMVPAELRREGLAKPYGVRMYEDDIVLNPSLVIMLNRDFNLALPQLPQDLNPGGLTTCWEQIEELVAHLSGWKVEKRVVLGIFSFLNLMIIEDLEKNRDKFLASPLVRAIASAHFSFPSTEGDHIVATKLDDLVAPGSTFQVLDADSTQQEVIEAAKSGLSLIVQGPPGTGKSQTIANIISEFLARGKRVLFVSQKIAALRVVKKRLEDVGLGHFCLEVHSHRRDKREVVAELSDAMSSAPTRQEVDTRDVEAQLSSVRRSLNSYVWALHRPHLALGISAFQAFGSFAQLQNAPKIRFEFQSVDKFTKQDMSDMETLVKSLAAYDGVINRYASHPWHGFNLEQVSFQTRAQIEDTLAAVMTNAKRFESLAPWLAQAYGVKAPVNLHEGAELLQVSLRFQPTILSLNIKEILRRYENNYQGIARYLRPTYWRDSGLLREARHDRIRPHPAIVIGHLKHAVRLQEKASERRWRLEAADPRLLLGKARELEMPFKEILVSVSYLSNLFDPQKQPPPLSRLNFTDFGDLVTWCGEMSSEIPGLIDWVNFNATKREAERLGLGSFVSAALTANLGAASWHRAFLRGLFTLILDAVAQAAPELRTFQSTSHNLHVWKFRELDLDLIRITREKVQSLIATSFPESHWMTAATAEESILRREKNKKRRLIPLRKLFAQVPDLLQTLKPCLMMSPLTVSQMLHPDLHHFDLVLFDEASQVPPEYAVGAIARGDQLIIAGDRHQLPPTRFFQVLDSDEDGEEETDEFESILNECDAAGMPSKSLLWHYRSRDESLIAFSNYHFYKNRLLTFPSADPLGAGTGVEFIHVPNGVYKRGKGGRYNRIEADRVVQLIIDHLRDCSQLSLGVVTFSEAQRGAIELILESRLRDLPTLQPLIADAGLEPFFVKSLEQVQGDERDVMIFSVGYGFDEIGKFLMQFGPLSKAGGEKRLNVAVTRAKRKVKLVASIQPEDIDIRRTESQGARLLRSYMTMARDGVSALYSDIELAADAEFESPFEQSVFEALTDAGLQLEKQVGVSDYRIDMAVLDPSKPGRYLLGIECDGAMYHSAATARDRDRIRQQVLEGLGWTLHRIWSRDWIENKEREIERVLHAVASVQTDSGGSGGLPLPQSSSTTSREVETRDSPLAPNAARNVTPPAGTVFYRRVKLMRQGSGSATFLREPAGRHIAAIQKVVELEGPVKIAEAKKRVAAAWDIQRIGKRVDRALDAAVIGAETERLVKKRGDFLWPPDLPTPQVRVPSPGATRRSIDEIPIEEIAEGVMICMSSALSLSDDDLIKEIARLFGLRATERNSESIKRAIRTMVRAGRIEWRSGKFRLPRV